jgi:hypothetical protein
MEDFGCFMEHAPGAMFTLGVRIDMTRATSTTHA